MKTQKEIYVEWLKDQVANHGLKYVHHTTASGLNHTLSNLTKDLLSSPPQPTPEDEEPMYQELNYINKCIKDGNTKPIE